MMKNSLLVMMIMFVVLMATACLKMEDGVKPDYDEHTHFIFGHFYGECGGEGCVEIYKLDKGKLWEDTTDVYPTSQAPYQGHYMVLADEKYDMVKDIVEAFPEALFSEPNNVIGIPDGGDWGGIYVEIRDADDEEKSGFWLLDQNAFNMPDVYNVYVDQINEKITFINQ